MTNSNKIRRITKLGIADFESADEVQRRQDDLLERLKPNMWCQQKQNTCTLHNRPLRRRKMCRSLRFC